MKSATVVHGPPGTGKSTHLVRLCGEYASAGAQVCLLSHTKAAAAELKERITENVDNVVTSTIHSMVYRLVGVNSRQVVTRERLVAFGEEIGVPVSGNFDINGEQERVIEDGDEALSIIGRADAKLVSHMSEYDRSERPVTRSTFKFVSEAYAEWKKSNMYVDFTDMLMLYIGSPVNINKDVLIVDEAQDLSAAQWAVIDKMVATVSHVIIAGDTDQQLFTWGGSDTHGMRFFADRFSANSYTLPQSYRIPVAVHTLALDVRSRIQDKVDVTYKPREAIGEVTRSSSPTSITFDARDTMVLYRTHAMRRELEGELLDNNVPYTVLNGLRDPWHSAFGTAVKAFVKLRDELPVTAKEKRVLERYCYARSIKAGMRWENCLDIPQRFLNYMLETEDKQSNVRLSTIHGAKGMEADRVILYTGLTQRVLDGMTNDPDSEHKVFYVGVTRAKETLDIVAGDMPYDL